MNTRVNNLDKMIREKFKAKFVVPNDELLKKADCTIIRFRKLRRQEVQMSAQEVVVFSEWLGCDPKDLIEVEETSTQSV